jgi:XTP/dITP diphosphohydrolase
VQRIVIATHNRHKAGEMVQILAPRLPKIEFVTLADFSHAPEPEESGLTYAENALIKARSAAQATQEWALADDAGLEVDALDGAPGLHSKRFGGEGLPFPEKMRMILDRLQDVPEEQRGARFRCCIALAPPPNADAAEKVLEATCEGRIAFEPSGSGGFGYDPIFWLPELGCTMADLTAEQKHVVSHRGKVLRQLAEWLRQSR